MLMHRLALMFHCIIDYDKCKFESQASTLLPFIDSYLHLYSETRLIVFDPNTYVSHFLLRESLSKFRLVSVIDFRLFLSNLDK